jgi:MFS family permease
MSSAAPAREPLLTGRFVALWCYAFITFFSAFQLLPAIPFRILELGGTKAEAGWFLSVYTFASAFAAPMMGSLADHIGRRRLLITASILFIGFSVAYGLITNLKLLLLIGAIHGSIWSAILSSSSAIMSEFIPESRRTQGFAWWGLASTAAITLAPAAGLWVFHFGWLTLSIELAVLSMIMSVWAVMLPVPEAMRPMTGSALGDAWDWRVVRTTLSLTCASIGYGGITSYSAIVAVERHVEPKSIYLTTFAITIVIFRVFFSHLGDRMSPKQMLYPTLALIPFAFLTLAFAQTRWQMMASAILFGIGFGGAYPAFATFVLANTDPRRRARTFGSIVWAFDTGIGTGSFMIGAIGQRFSLATAFVLAAVVSSFAIPIFEFASRGLATRGTSLAADLDHGTE